MALPIRTHEELERAISELLADGPYGRRLAILARNSWSAALAREAASAAGATAVPLNPMLTPAEMEPMLRCAGAEHLFYGPGEAERAEGLAAAVGIEATPVCAADRGEALRIGAAPASEPTAERIGATIIFTSGTTGQSKGCLRGAECEAARAADLIETFAIGPGDVHLLSNPMAHSAPGIFYRAARCAGAETVLLPAFRAEEFLRVATAERATLCFVVPTQLGRMLAVPPAERAALNHDSLRAVIVAGSPLRPELRRQALDWLGHRRLWEFYGSSETGTISVLRPSEQAEHDDTVGRSARGVTLDLRHIDAAGVGEIHVRGPAVMDGYLDPQGGLKALPDDGFVATGDLGWRDDAGYLHLVDRVGDMIITGGVNVYPAEVERVLCRNPAVAAAVVTGVEDDDWGQRVVALIALAGEEQPTDAELLAVARDSLAGYKLPKAIVRTSLDAMPIGPSGKPLRRRAREIIVRSLAGE